MECLNISNFESHRIDLEKSKKLVGGVIEVEIKTNSTKEKMQPAAAAVEVEITITETDTIKL